MENEYKELELDLEEMIGELKNLEKLMGKLTDIKDDISSLILMCQKDIAILKEKDSETVDESKS